MCLYALMWSAKIDSRKESQFGILLVIGIGFELTRGILGSTCTKKGRLIFSVSEVESTRREEGSTQTKKVKVAVSVDEGSSRPEEKRGRSEQRKSKMQFLWMKAWVDPRRRGVDSNRESQRSWFCERTVELIRVKAKSTQQSKVRNPNSVEDGWVNSRRRRVDP